MLEEKAGYLDDMPLNIRIVNIKNYPLHYHDDHEFIYVLRGFVMLKCGSNTFKLQQGDVFIMNDGEVHGMYDCSNDNIVLMIQINASYFIKQFPTLPYNIYRTMEKEKGNKEIIVLRNFLLKIALNYVEQRPGYKIMNTNIMMDIINYCNKNFKFFYFVGKEAIYKKHAQPEIGERLGRTIGYIYEHHNEKLSLRELAEKEHFSEWYMSKLITAGTGLSFRELLAYARVDESESLLLSTTEKISRIAAMVGFSTTAYYEKFFKKWFGCHPEEYRKMYSGKIKGNAPELAIELNRSEAMSVILEAIRFLTFATDEDAGKKLIHKKLVIDAAQEKEGIFRQNIVCLDNSGGITGTFYNLAGFIKGITAEHPGDETDCCEFDSDVKRYALESVLVIPYMVKKVLNNRWYKVPACSNRKEHNVLLDGTAGIFTEHGIPKPMFNACRVTKLLEGELLSYSDYYVATRSADGKQISVLLYNTEPDLEMLCENKSSMREVQNAIDKFSTNSLSVTTEITNIDEGIYQIIESTYTHANSLFYLAYKNNYNRQKMTVEEVMTNLEMVTPSIVEREEYFDEKIELEYGLKGASSKLIRIIKK